MANESDKRTGARSQRDLQRELIELKQKKQAFMENPDEFKPEGPAPAVEQTTRSKLANLWYYGKHTLCFILIVAVILTVGISQCAGRTKYDLTFVFYFKHYVSSGMIDNISMVAEEYCKDYNNDGEVNVLVMDCAIPEDERLLDTGMAKSSRLMTQFASSEAIVYIVDKSCLFELDELAGGVFVDDSLNLPAHEGKAFPLNGTVFDEAFNAISDRYSEGFEYYLIRRVVEGTAIEKKSDVQKHSNRANEFIQSVVNDPTLGGKELDLPDASGTLK